MGDNQFYKNLLDLCEERGEKITPLVKSLGLSTGNIKKWAEGATVNSDILKIIANHFDVSTDYLLTGKEVESPVFYKRFIKLCEHIGEKPTPTVKAMGISAGNMRRWEEGATTSTDILYKFSEYFKVPFDYFFLEEYENIDIDCIKKAYTILKETPDVVASIDTGCEISLVELVSITDYLRKSISFLSNESFSDEEINKAKEESKTKNYLKSPKDFIMFGILNKVGKTREFRFVQGKISMIVIQNLSNANMTREMLLKAGIDMKKLSSICDIMVSSEKKMPFTASELWKLSQSLNISVDYMLTGEENKGQ